MTTSAIKTTQITILNRHLTFFSAARLSSRLETNSIRKTRLDSSLSTCSHQHQQLHTTRPRYFPRETNVSSTTSPLLLTSPSASARGRYKYLPAYSTHTQRAHTTTTTLRSSAGSWTLAAIVIIGGVIYTLIGDQTTPKQVKLEFEDPQQVTTDDVEGKLRKMSGEILPGRPGTLTAEEDEKLRQLWVATLQVLGVLDSKDGKGEGADAPADSIRFDNTSSKKEDPKKKRTSLFRRNKESKETQPSSTAANSDLDDKYGQTKEFHETLASMSPETLRKHFWAMMKVDSPDAFLLRFLRARKWDVEKALAMMFSTIKWRAQDVHVDDDIMLNGELAALEDSTSSDPTKNKRGTDFMNQLRQGKSFLHGLDQKGRPMCFIRVRLHKAGEQSEESMARYTVFVIESTRLLLNPPVDTACVVFDMTGFSLANMDYGPVKFMIKCFEANYPESLGVVLVHKAPWVFQGIWKIIRGWLDPVVASKIHFTSDYAAISEFIDPAHIPTDLGGTEAWEYSYLEPVSGENDLMKDTVTRDKIQAEREALFQEYESQTLAWINGQDVASAKLRRAQLTTELKMSYWRLDPYIRAKTLYDRQGMIGQGGNITFYPGEATTATNGTGSCKSVETFEADLD